MRKSIQALVPTLLLIAVLSIHSSLVFGQTGDTSLYEPLVADLEQVSGGVGAGPGPIDITGPNSASIVLGDEDTLPLINGLPPTVVAAGIRGSGRGVCYGHDAFLHNGMNTFLDNETLAENVAAWVGQGGKRIVFDSHSYAYYYGRGVHDGLVTLLTPLGYSMTIASGSIDSAELSQADIFVAAHRQASLTAGEVSALTAFAENGGGIICVGLAWSWLQGAGHTLENYPMNSIANIFDMAYVDGWIHDPTNNVGGDQWNPIFHTFLQSQTGYGTISGTVTNAKTGQGIVGATVYLLDKIDSSDWAWEDNVLDVDFTGSNGQYSFDYVDYREDGIYEVGASAGFLYNVEGDMELRRAELVNGNLDPEGWDGEFYLEDDFVPNLYGLFWQKIVHSPIFITYFFDGSLDPTFQAPIKRAIDTWEGIRDENGNPYYQFIEANIPVYDIKFKEGPVEQNLPGQEIYAQTRGFGLFLTVTFNSDLDPGSNAWDPTCRPDTFEKLNDVRWTYFKNHVDGQTQIDVERVALHEIGHALGLGHPSSFLSHSIMHDLIYGGEWDHTINWGDVLGIKKLYGDPLGFLAIIAKCPVDLYVTDPLGNSISKSSNGISESKYFEADQDYDGEPDDTIMLNAPINGQYQIEVIPEEGAGGLDTYSLYVLGGFGPDPLAKDVMIQDIPPEGYTFVFNQGETNVPPISNAGADQVVECASSAGTSAILDGSASTDQDSSPDTNDDIVSFEWSEGGSLLGSGETLAYDFALGSHTIILVATDSVGQADSDDVQIDIVDTTLPEIVSISITPDVLWPPNHKMVEVAPIIETNDNCCGSDVTVSLISVQMNEGETENTFDPTYDMNLENGFIGDDTQRMEDKIYLRAERNGKSDGRIYTLTYEVADCAGNTSTASVTVTVPHDMGE